MLPPEQPATSVRDLLGDAIEVRKFVKKPGKPVPDEVWIPATIVNEDPYGIDVVYDDGRLEALRKSESKLRRRQE